MTADPKFSRRALLASGVALSTAIAGCSGGEDGSATPSQSGNTTAEGTPTATAQQSSDSTPSLSEFDYPEGATQDGIDRPALYDTHVSTVTDAGSVTFTVERTVSFDGGENTTTTTNQFSSGDAYGEIEEGSDTRYVWSPSGDDKVYMKIESGFDTAYRIDNEAPRSGEVTGLEAVESLLFIATWGEAVEVVESDDGFAVTYETTGLDPNVNAGGGSGPTSVEGSMTVADSGYIRGFEYTTNYSDGSVVETTGTISSVGETTAEAPAWLDTAREEGVQFTSSLTDGGTAFRLEMTNGNEISSDARLSLRDGSGRGESSLQSALTTGDVLYVGLSDSSELLTSTDQPPAEARELRGRTRIAIRDNGFELFSTTRSLR